MKSEKMMMLAAIGLGVWFMLRKQGSGGGGDAGNRLGGPFTAGPNVAPPGMGLGVPVPGVRPGPAKPPSTGGGSGGGGRGDGLGPPSPPGGREGCTYGPMGWICPQKPAAAGPSETPYGFGWLSGRGTESDPYAYKPFIDLGGGGASVPPPALVYDNPYSGASGKGGDVFAQAGPISSAPTEFRGNPWDAPTTYAPGAGDSYTLKFGGNTELGSFLR